MDPILVPAPPRSSYNQNRRVSDLLYNQLRHFQHVELKRGDLGIDPEIAAQHPYRRRRCQLHRRRHQCSPWQEFGDVRRPSNAHPRSHDEAHEEIAHSHPSRHRRSRLLQAASPKKAPTRKDRLEEASDQARQEEEMKPRPLHLCRRSPHRPDRDLASPGRSARRRRRPYPLRLPSRVARELDPCQQQLVKPCSPFPAGHLVDIGQTLVLGDPLHIALGSLAPQNGFAAGLAFVEHKDFASERRLTALTSMQSPATTPFLARRLHLYRL